MAACIEFYSTTSTIFDANNDGHADIFFGTTSFISYVLLNDGHGDFSASTRIPTPTLPLPVNGAVLDAEAVDINGDGNADLALAIANEYVEDYIQILIGDGTGHFTDETGQRFPHIAEDNKHKITNLHPADFNKDGYVDFVDRAPFLMNDGTGHFIRLPNSFPGSKYEYDVRVRDFNNDGRLDVLTLQNGDGGKFRYAVYIQKDPGRHPMGTNEADGLVGDKTNEKFQGLGGKDVVFGGLGKDRVSGGDGADYLNGGDGNDTIKGGGGGDTIVGAIGTDKLIGAGGKDIFKFNSVAESPAARAPDCRVGSL